MIQAPKASCEARANLRASLAKYPLAGGERTKARAGPMLQFILEMFYAPA